MLFASSSTSVNPTAFVPILVIAAVVWLIVRQNRKLKAAFTDAIAKVGGELVKQTSNGFTIKKRGFEVSFELAPGAKSTPPHTYIHVKTPPFDLLFDLVREGDKTGTSRAGYVDIEVGDAAFDLAWIVEGAPADRMKRLLSDASLRARLVECANQKGAEVQAEDGDVHFTKEGHDYDKGVLATENLELILDLAAAVVAENALASPTAAVSDGDYRSAPAANTDRSGERQQIADLKRERAGRGLNALRIFVFLVPALMVLPIIVFLGLSKHVEQGPGHAAPYLGLIVVGFFFRSPVKQYLATRRAAGLGTDWWLWGLFAALVVVALASYLGLFAS